VPFATMAMRFSGVTGVHLSCRSFRPNCCWMPAATRVHRSMA
jgi:hypothetical protein